MIAFDAYAEGYINAASLTYPHTCGGLNRFLHVVIKWYGANDLLTITYAGQAMDFVSDAGPMGEGTRLKCYVKMNPASGTNNVVITRSSADHIVATSASYTGAKQTGQPEGFGTDVQNSVNYILPTVTVLTADSWVIGGAVCPYQGGVFGDTDEATLRKDNLLVLPGICGVFDRNAPLAVGARTLKMHHVPIDQTQFAAIALAIAPAGVAVTPSQPMVTVA